MKSYLYIIKRILGYVIGFVLFYEPFMLFSILTSGLFNEAGFTSLHVPCARIPLANIVTGNWAASGSTSLVFCLLLAVTSLWLGPICCGKLCIAGGFSEFLGSLLPEKFKIDWPKLLPVLPIRCGFFVGFLFSVWLGLGVPCAYCNYYALEIFVNYFILGHLLNTMTSLVMTFVLSNVVLGLFTKGGRGYCQMLCPVGAYNSFFHWLGQFIPGPFRMHVNKKLCVGCSKCVNACPMGAIDLVEAKAQIDTRFCIICGKCKHNCPVQAIKYSSNINKE